MNYFVYIYKYKDDVVYVGQTTNLDNRIKQHCQEIKFYGLQDIYYTECQSKKEMDDTENYLIYFLEPSINKTKGKDSGENIKKDIIWEKYKKPIIYDSPFLLEYNLDIPTPIYECRYKEVGKGFVGNEILPIYGLTLDIELQPEDEVYFYKEKDVTNIITKINNYYTHYYSEAYYKRYNEKYQKMKEILLKGTTQELEENIEKIK